MHVMWWMPSKRMVQIPFAKILAYSNNSTETARPAAGADAPLPGAVGRLRLGERPRMVAETAGLHLDRPARDLDGLPEARAIEDEPLPAVAARVEPGERRAEERERRTHGVEQEQVPAADAPDRLERPDRVGDHLQDEAHDDDVVLTR